MAASPTPSLNIPPALGETDKTLLQDMIAERAKLRDGIPDTLRYAAIALAGAIVFAINSPYPAPQTPSLALRFWFDMKMRAILWLTLVLLLGLLLKLYEMVRRLGRLNERINKMIQASSVPVKEPGQLPVKDKSVLRRLKQSINNLKQRVSNMVQDLKAKDPDQLPVKDRDMVNYGRILMGFAIFLIVLVIHYIVPFELDYLAVQKDLAVAERQAAQKQAAQRQAAEKQAAQPAQPAVTTPGKANAKSDSGR